MFPIYKKCYLREPVNTTYSDSAAPVFEVRTDRTIMFELVEIPNNDFVLPIEPLKTMRARIKKIDTPPCEYIEDA